MNPSISVGDGHSIPVTNTGHSILPSPTKSLPLNNVLITLYIVKKLIYVRDNNCTIEFDAFGFSVKDFLRRRVLLQCDSTGDLYPVTTPSSIPHAFLVSQHTWHQRLGEPGAEVLRRLVSSNFISYNKEKPHVLCHACQFRKHVRLPFVSSSTVISSCFDIIHSDVLTSPILSLLDGTLSRYKARLVANSSTHLAASRHWPIHQPDVKNAFLHGDLSKTVYMHQPPGFQDSVHPDYVCLLQRQRTDTAYLLLYVDDIVLTASFESLLQQIIRSLHQEFAMTDLGPLNLGKKYSIEILDKAHMDNCNPSRTPIDTESKLGSDDLVAYSDGDCAGCPTTRRSTSGYYVFLGNNLLSWSSKHQPTLSRSSAEAEYHGVANVVANTCWLRNLLREFHTPLSSATLVYCDNVSAVYLSCNPVQH
uniref:Ribonuclease H-like domain-containing protein n=1 Tax=Tanacetum cinerariifolium TaxID=118510 RepID=A0A6L2MKD5_TANCI|nr:ribonuclease H-like domain-containing protein [Tanacetum cinerariifolium]